MRLNPTALRVIRERSGESAAALATAAGIDPANYSRLESGIRRGTEAQIVALAAALKVPVLAIIDGIAA
jgi:transcriptional regulator with XRE-family HTH domain